MIATKYTQGIGFTVVDDIENWLGFKFPDSWKTVANMLKEAGWSDGFNFDEYPPNFSRSVGATNLSIHPNKDHDRFLVEIDDGCTSEWIVVEGIHNLMALKIAVAPMLQLLSSHQLLSDIANTVDRSFMHKHEHSPKERKNPPPF